MAIGMCRWGSHGFPLRILGPLGAPRWRPCLYRPVMALGPPWPTNQPSLPGRGIVLSVPGAPRAGPGAYWAVCPCLLPLEGAGAGREGVSTAPTFPERGAPSQHGVPASPEPSEVPVTAGAPRVIAAAHCRLHPSQRPPPPPEPRSSLRQKTNGLCPGHSGPCCLQGAFAHGRSPHSSHHPRGSRHRKEKETRPRSSAVRANHSIKS